MLKIYIYSKGYCIMASEGKPVRAMVGHGAGRAASANMIRAFVCVFVARLASADLLDLPEGAACKGLGGEPGTCQLLTDCHNPGDFKRNHPPICNFRGKLPVICCPDSLGLNEGDFRVNPEPNESLDYCRNYTSLCEKQRELAGSAVLLEGKSVKPYDYTYMAVIGYGEPSDKVWNCGGSLITTRYIVSAATCSDQYILGPARWARLGGLDILHSSLFSQDEWNIVKRIVHPDYSEPALYNNIALFQLQKDVSFDLWLGPVCLHSGKVVPKTGLSATIWGKTNDRQISHDLLDSKKVITNEEECRRHISTSTKFPNGLDLQRMFCAGVEESDPQQCSMETVGGPLLASVDGQCLKTLVGVASYHKRSCEPQSHPTLYTRVSYYLRWIEEIVFPS